VSEVEDEIEKLLKSAASQEERNEIWKALFEYLYERSDDEE
jgi:hypothetical protein